MRFLTKLFLLLTGVAAAGLPYESLASSDFVVYGVQQQLNMGETDEVAPKDIYVNMGTRHGLQKGTKLQTLRAIPTYDLINRRLFGDLAVPVAVIRIIHADEIASVGRVESLAPQSEAPVSGPRAVMIGDIVRPIK